jgi:hypothetical protein
MSPLNAVFTLPTTKIIEIRIALITNNITLIAGIAEN